MSSRRLLPDVVLLAVAVTWGGSYLGSRELAAVTSAPAVMCLRFVPAAVLLLALVAVSGRLRALRTTAVPGLLLGVLRAATIALETVGVTRTTATNAGLIIGLSVLITPMLEAAVTRRRPSGALLAAALLGTVGIALLVGGDGFSAPNDGDLLVLAAAGTRALLGVAEAHCARRPGADVLTLTTVELALGAAVFAVWGGASALAHVPDLTGAAWATLAYLCLGCTLLAFLGTLWATRRTSASRAAVLLGTEPAWALLVGILLAGETLGATALVGALVLLVSVVLGGRAESRWRALALGPAAVPAPVRTPRGPARASDPPSATAASGRGR